MDCGGQFAKYVLFIFNTLVLVIGILLIVFGSITISQISNIGNVETAFNTHSVPITILILGCVIFIISFMGCCGAIRENTCFLMTYSVVMLALFVCQVALIVYVWTQRSEILNAMDTVVTKIWEQHTSDQKVMDALQLAFNCCGKNRSTDYTLALQSVPVSCCGAKATTCSNIEAMQKPGCARAVASFWETNTDIIRYAGLGIAGVELVAFIFGCCLANQVRNSIRRTNY